MIYMVALDFVFFCNFDFHLEMTVSGQATHIMNIICQLFQNNKLYVNAKICIRPDFHLTNSNNLRSGKL